MKKKLSRDKFNAHFIKKGAFDAYLSGTHTFLHRYMNEAKAAKKGDMFASRKEREHGIEQASYQIISKNSRQGKESGYFRGLNRIYRFATQLLYTHVDNYSGCPNYPG